jgi:hypothetical protein
VRAFLHEHHRLRNRACPVRHTELVIGIGDLPRAVVALRLPTASAWIVNATIEGETREHEAAHAVSAHLLETSRTETAVAIIAIDRPSPGS